MVYLQCVKLCKEYNIPLTEEVLEKGKAKPRPWCERTTSEQLRLNSPPPPAHMHGSYLGISYGWETEG